MKVCGSMEHCPMRKGGKRRLHIKYAEYDRSRCWLAARALGSGFTIHVDGIAYTTKTELR